MTILKEEDEDINPEITEIVVRFKEGREAYFPDRLNPEWNHYGLNSLFVLVIGHKGISLEEGMKNNANFDEYYKRTGMPPIKISWKGGVSPYVLIATAKCMLELASKMQAQKETVLPNEGNIMINMNDSIKNKTTETVGI